MLAITNVELLHDRQLLVVHTYAGEPVALLHDEIIKPYVSNADVIEVLRELGVTTVITADHRLAVEILATPGMTVEVKHALDTIQTRQHVDRYADDLIVALDIETLPPLPAWKTYVITKLGGIIKWLQKR